MGGRYISVYCHVLSNDIVYSKTFEMSVSKLNDISFCYTLLDSPKKSSFLLYS